jgi:hypothetical protein
VRKQNDAAEAMLLYKLVNHCRKVRNRMAEAAWRGGQSEAGEVERDTPEAVA